MTKLDQYLQRLGIEGPSATAKATDVEAGKAGYNQYLADIESFKKAQEETQASVESNKSWWDKASDFILRANGMSSQMSDNPIASGFNAAVEAYKNIPEDNKPSDDWTDEERWAFGEKYSKDKNDAYSFAKQLNNDKANAKKAKQSEKLSNWATRNGVNRTLASIGSLGINAAYGGLGFYDALAQKAAGRDTFVNHGVLLPHEATNAMQGAIADYKNKKWGTLDERIPIIGGKGVGDAYQLRQSILQSFLSGGGEGALVQFFGMAASQGVSDALARGATSDQALAMGLVSGLAEAIPEMISVDKVVGMASAEGVQNLFKNILKQAGQEAGEEFATSVINELADAWIMGGKSNYNQTVNALIASGMSPEQAKNRALAQTLENLAYDVLSGAISGGVSGAGATGISRVNQQFFQKEANAKAKEVLTPESGKLIEEGKKYDTTKKRAEALEKKLADGKELSGYELRMLAGEVTNAQRSADVDTVRKAIVERMKSEGLEDGQANRLGEIALNKAIGNEISKVQELMLKRNPAAMKVYSQMSEEMMQSDLGDSEWAKNTPIEKLRAQNKASVSERDTEQRVHSGIERLKADIASRYGVDTKEYKINMDSIEGKFGEIENKIVYKPGENSKIHVDGISSSLTQDDIVELSAVEKIANELGIDIHVYETKADKKTGERVYTDKNGKRYSDSGFYDPSDNSIHIDLRAGENGEGTMLYTASHEVVHFIKENAAEHYAALEELVTKELIQGGFSIDTLIEEQRKILRKNGWDGTETNFEAVAREEMVAEACQSFLASKNAVAEIKALKTKNKGLWSALKKFFTSLFAKINKVYKTVPPDSAEGKYIASMRKAVKPIRDAFMEGAVEASKNAEKAGTKSNAEAASSFEKSYHKTKDIRKNARYTKEHLEKLNSLEATSTTVPIDTLVSRYEKIIGIWNELGGEINSEFLKQWNDKSGKDRAFSVFKAQAGYKYNVELSSMCKKGIPLFEAIDQIVRKEVMSQLNTKTLGKAEKEILYELLKEKKFDIPCAICYVEQARQREGDIIDAFLDGKIKKTATGKTKTHKIGWNETFDALEKGMKARGVDYKFIDVSRNIASDSYSKENIPAMDDKTQKAFYDTLLQLINKEIARYNAEKRANTKARMPLNSVTPSEIKRCLGGTLPANLKLYKTIAMNPDSRFKIQNDLLYSSETTTNLASYHHDLYSLFNMQGGVSGYKSKQGAVVYLGDILDKKWDSSKLRKEGGVINQSNSDFMMYTLLDQAQMYIDFTAKGYYLQAYTKVISELKLFGLSKGKINASLIPRVEIYRKDNGFEIDIEKTRENAGLDKNGNPIYDDIEGIPHEEAFMLIEDADYSKNIGGICIGYSDRHISKLLDDARIQLIIGYHDKTDDPDKRYRGARYAKNYNGENEARVKNADGTFTTKHVGFNQFIIAAEKLFKKGVTSTEYNGKTYKYDDIPKLAADMYLKMCADKNYVPAYDKFSSHKNYYKLLADFSLYDSAGHYAPHQKVAYEMPDVVPFLDADGSKKYMPTRDYIKKELEKELTVRDDISAALSDHTENGIIPKFVKQANQLYESQNIRHKARDSAGNELTLQQQEYFKDSAVRDKKGNLLVLYHGTTADFNTFKKGDVGFHFGTKGAARGRVGYGKNVNLKEVYLNITNPIVFDEDLGSWDADFRLTRELYERGVLTWEEAETVLLTDNKQYRRTTEAANKKLAYVLQSKGYDGISYTNTFESKTPTTSYIIFDSNQAKLITNTEPTLDKDIRHQARVGIASDGKKIFQSNFPKGTPKAAKSERILGLIQNVWSKKPISLVISNGETSRTILAQFDPTIDENKIIPTDASKIAGGNRHGNHTEQRVTLDLADDYYEIASDAKYNYSKKETGKKLNTHNDVNMWHYFFTEIYFMEQEGDAYTPYTVTVNVKEKDDGDFVYSFNAEKESSTRQTLHADVITYKGDNGELFLDNRIAKNQEDVNPKTENSSKNIRHKPRRAAPAPYVSPTATSIVTDIDSGYDYTGKDKFISGAIATQIAFTNAQAGIESIAKKYGVKNIESLVQAARVASRQADEMISGSQYRIGADTKVRLGDGLQKIFSPIEEKGEEVKQAFFDYLFHYHNADRMSLEQRSIEWNEEKKKEHQAKMKRFTELQKEQTALFKEKAGLTRKQSDSARRQEINQRLTEIKREIATVTKLIKKLQKEIDSFVPLKNKAVIGLNRAEIMAKKEELSKQIDELIAQKKALGRSKQNAAEASKISLKISELIAERDSLTAEVTAEKSKETIAEYEKNYDYFREVAEKIWQYNRNLNQYRVDTGLINQEQFDYLEKLYPHYVPSYRADVSTGIAAVKGKNNLAISQSIKTATGSTKDLLNPIVIMARQTMETIRAGRINQIAEALYNGAGQDKTYLAEISRKKVNNSEVADIDPTELRPKANQVTFFKNGEIIVLQVSSEIFAGFDAFAPMFDIKNPLVRGVSKATELFKKLVTSANPVFLIRNAVRDLQDAGINTKYSAKAFMLNYAEAIKQIKENGELWELYKAMGGSNASYFDFDKGFLAEQTKRGFSKKIKDEDAGKAKKAWQTAQGFAQTIENANAFVETLPRLAEFISSIQAGNTAEQAMLDAADVTTNFARSGKITKALNSTVIPFLNPAIQGASKAVRNVTSIRSLREAAILAAKATILGIAPFLLNALLYRDDEDYEDLRESDKENNYLFKIGDTFVKIPRGRVASVLAGATNRSVKEFFTDEDVDWGDYLKNVSTQMNPLENMARTIFSPFLDVVNNVTWYGSAIEGREFENKAPKDRFDEGTSSIAIAMGKVLNYSPKKIHYLIDQYSGVIGDFILPATTKKAEKGFLSGNFTIDPVTANKLSDDFYDIYYEAQYAKSADPNDKVAEYQVKHLNRVKSSISELFKAKDEIQNSNMSDREKRAETEAIQILINEAYKTALTDYELITNAIKATSRVEDKYRYTEVLHLVYGAETALKEWDDDVYALSTTTVKAGISYDVFYKYYFSTRDIESDKDKYGNAISGSKKKKTIEKIESLNLSADRQRLLIALSGYSLDSENEKEKLIKYINSLRISAKDKELLAKKCNFTYKNGKIYP